VAPYLVDVLALQLLEESLKAVIISLNTNGVEDALDVLGGRGGVAGKAEEEVSCQVLHCDFLARMSAGRSSK
jgi:hypothetical protein